MTREISHRDFSFMRRDDVEFRNAVEFKGLDLDDLLHFWKHYTVGRGAGLYSTITPECSFRDYVVLSAWESAHEQHYDA